MIDGKRNYFRNNLMIYVKKRVGVAKTGIHDWAALLQFTSENDNEYTLDNMEVSGNVG
jgi:hypothetical protein